MDELKEQTMTSPILDQLIGVLDLPVFIQQLVLARISLFVKIFVLLTEDTFFLTLIVQQYSRLFPHHGIIGGLFGRDFYLLVYKLP